MGRGKVVLETCGLCMKVIVIMCVKQARVVAERCAYLLYCSQRAVREFTDDIPLYAIGNVINDYLKEKGK